MNSNTDHIQTCYKHINRQTLLRCNQCGRPICLDCAISTPTGYRCKECIKEQQRRFNNSISRDYILAGLIAFILGLISSYFLMVLRFLPGIFALLLGPSIGMLVVKLVRAATQKRRSSTLNQVTVIAAGVGAGLPLLGNVFRILHSIVVGNFRLLFSNTLEIGWGAAFLILLCSVILTNMKGFSIRR